MLTPEQLRLLPQNVLNQYTELNNFILADISRRIAKGGMITETAEFQIYRAQSLGLLNKEIKNKIAEINNLAEKEIDKLYTETAERSDMFDKLVLGRSKEAGIPLAENGYLQQLINAQMTATRNEMTNFSQTLGFISSCDGGVSLSLQDMYIKQLDMAHLKIVSGASDYDSAIKSAVKVIGDSGVRVIDYTSGRSESIESAVRRSVLHGISTVTAAISKQNGDMFGADGWEISAHAGARPSHAEHQGRQYPNNQYESIVRPLIEDYNCRHSAYPIIMGVSTPMYTDEELQNIDPPPFTYEGKTYSAFEASDRQRYMERCMRRTKNRIICYEAAGNEKAFQTESIKLARQKEKYIDFFQTSGNVYAV